MGEKGGPLHYNEDPSGQLEPGAVREGDEDVKCTKKAMQGANKKKMFNEVQDVYSIGTGPPSSMASVESSSNLKSARKDRMRRCFTSRLVRVRRQRSAKSPSRGLV